MSNNGKGGVGVAYNTTLVPVAMQNINTFEHRGYHVLYFMCKTHQPGVHQVAHDGPDGITTCS